MSDVKEEDLTPTAVLETDFLRGVLNSTKESVLFSIPGLRSRLNTPAQSFAGVVTFNSNVIVDGVTALNDALGVAGIATFADDLIIADGKSIGNITGPNVLFDETNDFFVFSGGKIGVNIAIPLSLLNIKQQSDTESNGFRVTDSGTGSYWELYSDSTLLKFSSNTNTRFTINRNGVVNMPDLAGIGTRNVVVDASGNLSAP